MVGPRWVPGESKEYIVNAAPFYMTPEDLRYYEGLNYTTQDLKLFAVKDLMATDKETGETDIEFEIMIDDIVLFGGKKYKVDNAQDYTTHADFKVYVAKLMPQEAEDND